MNEQGTEAVLSLVEATEDRLRCFSSLAVLEVRSALRRREALGEITTADAQLAIELLEDEARRVVQSPITATVLQVAADIVDRYRLRALDAIQLGTALQISENQADMPLVLVTSDHRLLDAARQAGLETLEPE